MKKILYHLFFLIGITTLFTGCSKQEVPAKPITPESTIYSASIESTETEVDNTAESVESITITEEVFTPESESSNKTDEEIIIPDIEVDPTMIVREETVSVPGLKKLFEFVFVSDTHLALSDERDADLQEYMAGRYEMFRNDQGTGSEDSFLDIINYVSDIEPDLLVLGGDITDAATWSNIEYLDELLVRAGCPWIYEMGNHDFNYGNQEYFSVRAYQELLPRFENVSSTSNGYQTLEFDEFIIFAVDDQNNQIPESAVTGLGEAILKSKPIILISHVPFEPMEANTLVADSIAVWGAEGNGSSKVLMGPGGKVPNLYTSQFMQMVYDENSPVILVLSGHVHFYHKDHLKGDLVQIISGPGFKKEVLKINLVPENQ